MSNKHIARQGTASRRSFCLIRSLDKFIEGAVSQLRFVYGLLRIWLPLFTMGFWWTKTYRISTPTKVLETTNQVTLPQVDSTTLPSFGDWKNQLSAQSLLVPRSPQTQGRFKDTHFMIQDTHSAKQKQRMVFLVYRYVTRCYSKTMSCTQTNCMGREDLMGRVSQCSCSTVFCFFWKFFVLCVCLFLLL